MFRNILTAALFRNAPFSGAATESKTINAATRDYLIFPKSSAKLLHAGRASWGMVGLTGKVKEMQMHVLTWLLYDYPLRIHIWLLHSTRMIHDGGIIRHRCSICRRDSGRHEAGGVAVVGQYPSLRGRLCRF